MVNIDAMGCQKDIAAKIVGGGGQYALAVKENQPHLYEDIERAFDEALDQGEPGVDFTECQTEGPRKGRQETRTCCVITNPKGIRDAGLWTGLTAIVMVISERVVNGVAGSETRYFIGVWQGRRRSTCVGYVVIGGSRTHCTGCWTSVSARMTKGIGRGTARRIWGGSGSWHCVCSGVPPK